MINLVNANIQCWLIMLNASLAFERHNNITSHLNG